MFGRCGLMLVVLDSKKDFVVQMHMEELAQDTHGTCAMHTMPVTLDADSGPIGMISHTDIMEQARYDNIGSTVGADEGTIVQQ